MTYGRIFPIPKPISENKEKKGSDFRPITCLDILYKLTIKKITHKYH